MIKWKAKGRYFILIILKRMKDSFLEINLTDMGLYIIKTLPPWIQNLIGKILIIWEKIGLNMSDNLKKISK